MTISEIKKRFESQALEEIPELIEEFKKDPRKGVENLCKQYHKRYEDFQSDRGRVELMRAFDEAFGSQDHLLAGIDEAGRGPLAGPVVAAAVVLPPGLIIPTIDDSKKLSENQREILYEIIMEKAISVGVGMVDSDKIDEINILQATFRAMKKALFSLPEGPEIILVDGNQIVPQVNKQMIQHAVIQGDGKSQSIAAASIIAKVTRDRIMRTYSMTYPDYDFEKNKGYGSLFHQEALKEIGPSPIHRMSFLRNILRD